MNNTIERTNRRLAQACFETIASAEAGTSDPANIIDALVAKLRVPRPMRSIRISQAALTKCLAANILPLDYFCLTREQQHQKYGNALSQVVTGDINVPNRQLASDMLRVDPSNPKAALRTFQRMLNAQTYDLITGEERDALQQARLADTGDKTLRDAYCSPKIPVVDLWLTPPDVIDEFFQVSGLKRSECFDPCACDDRWLQGEGQAIDILPMNPRVAQRDFQTVTKADFPPGIRYVVGNIPFSRTKAFVDHALSLANDVYFLVNGDTIFRLFPNQIQEVFIFSGLEGRQKDNRSRCEFTVPFLGRSALWCCLVHITRETQQPWTITHNLRKEQRRDGHHIAIGWNTFIDCGQPVDDCDRIKRIPVQSSLRWRGGKKIWVDGQWRDANAFFEAVWDAADEKFCL